ncbi:MAG TPA: hypothetical protein V6D02_10985 [Candidatus Obscuribacterales bacterium]
MAQVWSAKKVIAGVAPRRPWAIAVPGSRPWLQGAITHRYGRWFWLASLAALVDGKLWLAIAASTLLYHWLKTGKSLAWPPLEPDYQRLCARLSRLGQRPLLASSLAFAATYGLATVGAQGGGNGAALALLSLGAGNVLLCLRVGGTAAPLRDADIPPGDATLAAQWDHLSAADPLKRLLAVRSLLHWSLTTPAATAVYLPGTAVTARSHLMDCFRLMLIHESEPLVRAALIEGLKALRPKPQLPAGQPALPPLSPSMAPVSVAADRTVEYIEP